MNDKRTQDLNVNELLCCCYLDRHYGPNPADVWDTDGSETMAITLTMQSYNGWLSGRQNVTCRICALAVHVLVLMQKIRR